MKNPEPSPACVVEPLPDYREYPQAEMVERARAFHAELLRRRTVRDFDTRLVPREVIENCLLAAGTAPSGANQQPWFFSVITDPEHKRRVRDAAEIEERSFYEGRAPQEWLDALAPKRVARTTCIVFAPSRPSRSTPRRRGAMCNCWPKPDGTSLGECWSRCC